MFQLINLDIGSFLWDISGDYRWGFLFLPK